MICPDRFSLRAFGIVLVLLLAGHAGLHACLNATAVAFTEIEARGLGEYPHPIGHPLDTSKANVRHYLRTWELGLAQSDFLNSCNYGVYLIYAHRHDEAEAHLRIVAERWPNEYAAAANLGTVLEIQGKDEEALQWIRRSIALDSSAHHGSEWIHVKILEAKVQGIGSFADGSQLGIDFGGEVVPSTTAVRRDIKLLQKQLFYQLNERITFIPPRDGLIAGLLFELGNTSLACGQMTPAYKTYRLAKRYGCTSPLLSDRLRYARKRMGR